MVKEYPSKSEIRKHFKYDRKAGLIRKDDKTIRPCINSRIRNKPAGSDRERTDRLSTTEPSLAFHGRSLSKTRLTWIYHNGDIAEGNFIYRVDPEKPALIENLYISKPKGRKVRPALAAPNNNYKGVYKRKESEAWCCEDLNRNVLFFLTEYAAATHYDNVCEPLHGYRPNGTKYKEVTDLVVTKAISRYRSSAFKSIRERGVVGVYKKRNRWAARCALINLGCFDTQEEAARAYNIAAKKHYGELAVINEIPDPFGIGEIF